MPSRRTWEVLLERGIEWGIRICGLSAIVFVFGIFFFVFREGASFLSTASSRSSSLEASSGIPPRRAGSVTAHSRSLPAPRAFTLLSMAIAVPFGLGAAIFISEFCPRLREGLKIVIELLAAIPSVVWGFIGLTIMNETIIAVFDAPIGLTVLNGSLILALMSVPIIVSIGEDALKAVPDSYREAAVALGATRWQATCRVLLPAARNGLLAAVLLGIGRAVGETMAVLMATGHAVQIPTSPLDSVRTLTATIAAELGEAPVHSDHYQVLFVIGILLFVITFGINVAADFVVRGIRRRS